MKKLHISYSALKAWDRYPAEQFIKYYFKLVEATNPAIEEGKAWDKIIEEEVMKNKKLPDYFFRGIKFEDPEVKVKIVTPYSDLLDLSGEMDIYDRAIIYEIKTGASMDSADWSRELQIPMYFLLCDLTGREARQARIVHYDQSRRTSDMTMMWKCKYDIDRVVEAIETKGMQIYKFFKKEGLI